MRKSKLTDLGIIHALEQYEPAKWIEKIMSEGERQQDIASQDWRMDDLKQILLVESEVVVARDGVQTLDYLDYRRS